MPLTADDPLEPFLELSPVLVALICAAACPGMIYLIELTRSFFDSRRAPKGLAIFRWTTVWIGDVLLAVLIGAMAAYYQRVQLESSIITDLLTSQGFFVLCGILSLVYSIGFILAEDEANVYPKGYRMNANRVYHFFYTWWMSYMLIGSLRALYYWDGVELVLVALVLFSGYIGTVLIDNIKPEFNIIWKAVVRGYPEQTRTP